MVIDRSLPTSITFLFSCIKVAKSDAKYYLKSQETKEFPENTHQSIKLNHMGRVLLFSATDTKRGMGLAEL